MPKECLYQASEHQLIVVEKKRLLQEYGFAGADPGTVYEVGYMIGQGKPAFGFTLDSRPYRERAGASGQDHMGHSIEDFELSDNLMIEGGIRESGGQLLVAEQPGEHPFFSAEVFHRCVRALTCALSR